MRKCCTTCVELAQRLEALELLLERTDVKDPKRNALVNARKKLRERMYEMGCTSPVSPRTRKHLESLERTGAELKQIRVKLVRRAQRLDANLLDLRDRRGRRRRAIQRTITRAAKCGLLTPTITDNGDDDSDEFFEMEAVAEYDPNEFLPPEEPEYENFIGDVLDANNDDEELVAAGTAHDNGFASDFADLWKGLGDD